MPPPPPAREGIWISGQLCGLRTLDSGAGETQSPQTCPTLHTAKTPGVPLLWFQSGSRCTCAYTKKDSPLISLKILSWRGWGGTLLRTSVLFIQVLVTKLGSSGLAHWANSTFFPLMSDWKIEVLTQHHWGESPMHFYLSTGLGSTFSVTGYTAAFKYTKNCSLRLRHPRT